MALRLYWPDERYARIYCRDTVEWLALSFDAKAVYVLLLRKADRRGFIGLGRVGLRAIAVLLGHAGLWSRIEPALAELLADGCIRLESDVLVISDFVAAQEAVSSGAARTRRWREGKAGDVASRPVPPMDEWKPLGDDSSQDVTPGYGTDGTARHGTGGTARLPEVAEFMAELDQEAALLAALPGRTFEVAEGLRRPVPEVELALKALLRSGLVRQAEDANGVMVWEGVSTP